MCYFSDERPSVHGYSQVLAHKVSTDGGKTWGPEVFDVAIKDNVQRPGMATVVKLPNGRYAMTFEDCKLGKKANYDPDETCFVYFKTSPDGLDWKPVSSLGQPIQTRDERYFLHTPYLAWSHIGNRKGTLIVSGQRIVTGKDGAVHVQPQSGHDLMINTHLGQGKWREIKAPFAIKPTGGYDKGETGCPGYSSPILSFQNSGRYLYMAGVAIPKTHDKCEIRYETGKLRHALSR